MYPGMIKMEHCSAKLHTTGQPCPECMSDTKSRFWPIGNQSLPRAEVICPQPHRATRFSCFVDSVNRFGPRHKSISPKPRGGDYGLEILETILSKDDEGTPMSFFCGSPPMRTNNPVIHDAHFAKQTHFVASPLGNSHALKQRGSPSCGSSYGGSPNVRIEGFACGSPESHCIVPALA